MIEKKESNILEAIQNIDKKLDLISKQISVPRSSDIDADTIAVITATAYHIFGRSAAIRKVQILK